MWKLVPLATAGEPFRLLFGVEHVVGRKNCSVLLQDDQSISRAHAVLSVSHSTSNLGQVSELPVLTVKDTSKYGTFVDKDRLESDTPRTLNSGDIITFGVYNSKFRVEYEPLVICSSCLDGPGKTALSQAVQQLGGHVVGSWTEKCTHLVMPTLKVTIKTICALVCNRPIIKPEYFTELLKAVQAKKQLPRLESFHPPLDEPSLKAEDLDLSLRPERKTIFRGKTFLFLNAKQCKKLSPAIILGGGEAKLLAEGSKDVSLLEAAGSCVIEVGATNSQPSVSEPTRKWIDSIMTCLQRKGLRAISEAEIGLAVIYMSMDVYCNPRSQAGTETWTSSKATVPGPTLSQSTAVEETIMPAPTLNITAYVPDTEPSQVDTRLEISGVREVKETPEKEPTGKTISQDISAVKETASTSHGVSTAVPLFSLENESKTKSESQRRSLSSQSKTMGQSSLRAATTTGKSKERASQQHSNLLSNYFQPIRKKRERDTEEDVSQTKLIKTEENQRSASQNQINLTSQSFRKTQSQYFNPSESVTLNLKTKALPVQSCEESRLSSSKDENSGSGLKKAVKETKTAQKRKEVDDLFCDDDILEMEFSRELSEMDVDPPDQGRGDMLNVSKKRKVEPEGLKIKEKDNESEETKRAASSEDVAEQKAPVKLEAKQELSESVKKETGTNGLLLDEEFNNLPNRLLLVEFKSLVVNSPRPAKSSTNPDYGEQKNFKKFKKVAFPGAGGLPQIIGGSDLVAHQTKKNSELEAWLRQELEDHGQHAREESLADDLFRYNPKTAKRRR